MNFFYKLKRNINSFIEFDNELILNDDLLNICSQYQNENDKFWEVKNDFLLKIRKDVNNMNTTFINDLFNIKMNDCHSILSKDFDNLFYIVKLTENGNSFNFINYIDNIHEKYEMILSNMISGMLYNKIKTIKSEKWEELLFINKMYILTLLFDYLQIGGNFILKINYICNIKTIEMIFLLTLLFENIIVYDSSYFYCFSFNPINKKEDIIKCQKSNFNVMGKINENDFYKYIINIYNYRLNILKICNNPISVNKLYIFQVWESLQYYKNNKLKIILYDNDFKKKILKNIRKNIKKIYKSNHKIDLIFKKEGFQKIFFSILFSFFF